MRGGAISSIALALAALGVAALMGIGDAGEEPAPREVASSSPSAPSEPAANTRPIDYVGPEACGECHADKYRLWRGNLHRAMNRRSGEPGALIGDFDGARLDYGDGAAVFETIDGAATMTFYRDGVAKRRYRVTRTIGRRYLQEYVGVEVDPASGTPFDAPELRLPFGYWRRPDRWVPRAYYDSWYGPEHSRDGRLAVDPYRPDEEPWAARCAWCHNTYPFAVRARRAQARQLGHGLEQYFELIDPSRSPVPPVADNILPLDELVTVGISCESCHLGGREHVAGGDISFVPVSSNLRLRPDAPDLSAGRDSSVVINTICAQCHSTPSPHFPNGAVTRNSSEALDMAGGACASQIRCTDCHDPHVRGPGAGAPDAPAHLAACTGCHTELADTARAREHAGHAPDEASCLDCHMPRIVQGVSDAVRSHHIAVPATEDMLEVGAPNACNLCHLDRSIEWTLDALYEGWGLAVSPGEAWREHYGERLDRPVGEAWLESDDPIVRLTAAAAYGRSAQGRRALPLLLELLDDSVAHDRMRYLFAIEDVLGRRLRRNEYDPVAPPERRRAMAERLRARLAP